MIGGTDKTIKTSSPSEVAEQVLRVIQMEWHEIVVEDAETGDDIQFTGIGFEDLPQEFFVYQNPSMKRLWDEHGACAENANKMFHVIVQQHQVTIVVDDPAATLNHNVTTAVDQFSKDLSLGRREFAI